MSVCGSTVTIASSSKVRKRSLRIANFTPCLLGMDVHHEPMVSFRSGFLAYRANLISEEPDSAGSDRMRSDGVRSD